MLGSLTAEDIDLRMDIEAAIQRLTAKQHRALMCHLAGYTQAEIAVLVGIDRSNVARRVQRAYERIRVFVMI